VSRCGGGDLGGYPFGHGSRIGERGALLRRQRLVLGLDDGDLHLQLALLVLQARPHRGGLLRRRLGIGGGLGGGLLGLGRLFPGRPETRHLRSHLTRHHPLHGEPLDQQLRRLRRQDGGHSVGAAAHVRRGGGLVDRALERGQARFCRVGGALVCGVLRFSGPLGAQLRVQVEGRAVHRFAGLLGLPGQLVEFCQRVLGRIGHDIRGHNAQQQAHAR
jgi:hypothetical protein